MTIAILVLSHVLVLLLGGAVVWLYVTADVLVKIDDAQREANE